MWPSLNKILFIDDRFAKISFYEDGKKLTSIENIQKMKTVTNFLKLTYGTIKGVINERISCCVSFVRIKFG